jgi:hypothetical protein
VQVRLGPCRLASADDADIGPALSQLPRLTRLGLEGFKLPGMLKAERAGGRWQVGSHKFLTPVAAAALARSFSGGAAPAGQQQQQPAAGAGGQRSRFTAAVTIPPRAPPSGQASQLASLGRALATFDDVTLVLHCDGEACLGDVNALLQPVAARLAVLVVTGSGASGLTEALGRLALPRLEKLTLAPTRDGYTLGAFTAVAGLDAPCLDSVVLGAAISGSRADAVAAVSALAMGRPRPVGPDGRPASLGVAVNMAVLSDEELGSVRRALPATRAGWVTVVRSRPS